jgi:NAD(P)H-hydrate repair Nnr-like enzyme with NAD(P)H-hydrate dehydratase domain
MADPPKLGLACELMLVMQAPCSIRNRMRWSGRGSAPATPRDRCRAHARDAGPGGTDADALNLVARDTALQAAVVAHRPTLATPHPGEAARVLGVDAETVQRDRMRATRDLVQRLNASVVLKGQGSVLAFPDGTWDINASGGPALATAGSGDILAGMLGALLAQGVGENRAAWRCVHGANADALVAQVAARSASPHRNFPTPCARC